MEISFNSTEIEDHPDSVNSFSDVQDDLSWVMHHVQSLGLKCEESDITPAMVEILHSLFSEVLYCHHVTYVIVITTLVLCSEITFKVKPKAYLSFPLK